MRFREHSANKPFLIFLSNYFCDYRRFFSSVCAMSAAHQPGSCSQTTPDPVSTDKPSLRLAQLECIKSRSGRVILCLQLRAPSQTGAVEAVFTGSPSLVLSVRGGTVLAEAQGVLYILLQLPPALYVGVTRVVRAKQRFIILLAMRYGERKTCKTFPLRLSKTCLIPINFFKKPSAFT